MWTMATIDSCLFERVRWWEANLNVTLPRLLVFEVRCYYIYIYIIYIMWVFLCTMTLFFGVCGATFCYHAFIARFLRLVPIIAIFLS